MPMEHQYMNDMNSIILRLRQNVIHNKQNTIATCKPNAKLIKRMISTKTCLNYNSQYKLSVLRGDSSLTIYTFNVIV